MDENSKITEAELETRSGINPDSDVDEKIKEIDRVLALVGEKLKASEEKSSKAAEAIISSSIKKKMISIIAVMAFAVITFASATYAYFTDTAGSQYSRIETAGGAKFSFVDLVYPQGSTSGVPNESITENLSAYPGESERREIYAVNKGVISIYVRAKIDCSITLSERYADKAGEIDTSLVSYDIDENNWITGDTFDGYYYYKAALPSGEKTEEFISVVVFSPEMGNMYKGSTVKLRVVFEVVQANGNGSSPLEAVGWPAASEGGAA